MQIRIMGHEKELKQFSDYMEKLETHKHIRINTESGSYTNRDGKSQRKYLDITLLVKI
jgi:hypothetical protein